MSFIQLSEDNCKHCMRCVRVCPTDAMTYIHNQPVIRKEECILCGKCYAICPHSAKKVSSDLVEIKKWLANKEKVVLSVAPSFVRVFPSFQKLKDCLLKKGFLAVDETAKGAKIVSEQYLSLMEEGKMDNIITTCCPAVVDLVRKEFPECIPYLAPVVSPMIAHAMTLKKEYPDAKVVFLTPCIAKKKEILQKEVAGYVDATISMEEMFLFLNENFTEEESELEAFDGSIARLYPKAGGILETLPESDRYEYLHVEDIAHIKGCLNALKRGELHHYFIEMSACDHSCINGPLIVHMNEEEYKGLHLIHQNVDKKKKIREGKWNPDLHMTFEAEERKNSEYSDQQIEDVLYIMGKSSRDQEYDCGACGYETCRLKAKAVLDGKADINLCLPKALQDATSTANLIISNTPNGIIVLDEKYNIEEINIAAKRMFRVEDISVIGLPIEMLLNDEGLLRQIQYVHHVQYYKCNYEKYGLYLDHAIIKIKENSKIILILMDLSVEALREKKLSDIRRQTIEVTNQVIDDQMRTVQEVASLLGETTAKAKVVLTNLKKELENDGY